MKNLHKSIVDIFIFTCILLTEHYFNFSSIDDEMDPLHEE